VAESKKPLFVNNVENDPRFKRENREERYGSASLLSVPLMVKNTVIGVINIAHRETGNEFGDYDLKLLTAFAAQAAVALDNASTFHLLKRRVQELSALQDINDAMLRAGTVQNLQDIIFWGIRSLMPVEMSLWFRWRHKEKSLTFSGGAGHRKIDLELTIKCSPSDIETPEQARELILEHLPPDGETGIPTAFFKTFFINSEAGLAYVFCLASADENCVSEEDSKIAGLIAGQAASMYEREKSILNATRLLTMGNMISEISHDMRKPLTNIRGGLQIMRSRWPEMADSSDLFKMAEEEVHRLNELVRELVDFSNPKKYQTERIAITSILERAAQLVSRDMDKKSITTACEFEDDLPDIFLNKNQIMEMFLNLIINAIDAMDEGGTLTLRAAREDAGTAKMIRTEISDTGCGIDENDLPQIFDRYYTRKETGTGLGLAVVERIVSAHGGRIEVDSTKGEGTTFRILLPR
jgi:nitrogen-specific signal transduction histidine kinase